MSAITPDRLAKKPERSMAVIALEIMNFDFSKPLKEGAPADPDSSPSLLKESLEESASDPEELDAFPHDHPINIAARRTEEYADLLALLEAASKPGGLPKAKIEEQRAILKTAPELIELVARRLDEIVKEARTDVAPKTGGKYERAKDEEVLRALISGVDPSGIGSPEHQAKKAEQNVGDQLECIRQTKNLREKVLPLFTELSEAFEREYGRGGARKA